MKRLLWQLPAVISGTAALTFLGVSTLQATVNAPLQEHAALVRSERAVAAAEARRATNAARAARPTVSATAMAGARPNAAASAGQCPGGVCGDPAVVVPRAAVTSQVAATPSAPHASALGDDRPPVTAASGAGKGNGPGSATPPGQNRDASGRPAKSKGIPQAGRPQNPGKGQGPTKARGAGKGQGAGKAQGSAKGQGAVKGQKAGKGKGPVKVAPAGAAPDRFALGPVGKPARPASPGAARRLDVVLRAPDPAASNGNRGLGLGHGR